MKVERDLFYLYSRDCSFVWMLFGSKRNLNLSAVPSVFQGIYNILYNSWLWWFFKSSPYVVSVWQAAGRHESLTGQNMEKKARWREELQREKEAAVTLSDKAQ